MMKTKTAILLIWVMMASVTPVLADHNAVRLDRLILGLPAGWEVHITRADFVRYGVPQLFLMQLELPTVEFEAMPVPGEKKMVHPTLTLCFYAPLTDQQYAEFQKKVKDEFNGNDQTPPPMRLLAKTMNYWVFTNQSADSFRHAKEEEIYHHMKDVLSINWKN